MAKKKIVLTKAQDSLETLPPETMLLGAVNTLLGFTVTKFRSIPKVKAAT